ncbi:hypothetical protein GQ53DRAFT_330132 [Thozetella sp. PMI_491]|nr:hypothetical protein GQ53DRAFT_330132 [Thozetella sp. PMI_491]
MRYLTSGSHIWRRNRLSAAQTWVQPDPEKVPLALFVGTGSWAYPQCLASKPHLPSLSYGAVAMGPRNPRPRRRHRIIRQSKKVAELLWAFVAATRNCPGAQPIVSLIPARAGSACRLSAIEHGLSFFRGFVRTSSVSNCVGEPSGTSGGPSNGGRRLERPEMPSREPVSRR